MFRDKETEQLWNRIRIRRFEKIERPARIKLAILASANGLADLRNFPGLRLEKLSGKRDGQ